MSETDTVTPASDMSRRASRSQNAAPGIEPRAARRRDWREGGRSTRRWGWEMVGWVVIALGVGVLAGTALTQFVGGAGGAALATAAMWLAMFVPIAVAFSRSVPRGLLQIRAVDVLYGLVLGVVLRMSEGWLAMAAGASGAFPTYGTLGADWWFSDLLAPVVLAPLLEEFFFHAVLLVALYSALRRIARSRAVAGVFSIVMTSGVFVLAHALTASLTWDAAVTLLLVGLVNATLVVLTGRVWGAVFTHVVFNATFVVLALVGTAFGAADGGVILQ